MKFTTLSATRISMYTLIPTTVGIWLYIAYKKRNKKNQLKLGTQPLQIETPSPSQFAAQLQRITELEKNTNFADLDALQELFELYVEMGNSDATYWFEKALALQFIPHSPSIKISPKIIVYFRSKPENEIAWLNQKILNNSNWLVYDRDALEQCLTLCSNNGNNLIVTLYLGMLLRKANPQKAVDTLRLAITKHNSVDAMILLAEYFESRLKTFEALELYESILINSAPNSWHYNIANEQKSKLHYIYGRTIKYRTTFDVQNLAKFNAQELEAYISNLCIDDLSLHVCAQKILINQMLDFCRNATDALGKRLFNYFTDEDSPVAARDQSECMSDQEINRYLQLGESAAFKSGLCLGLCGLFLSSSMINDVQSTVQPADDLRWFYRCCILLQVPLQNLSAEQKLDVSKFISHVVHLQNSEYEVQGPKDFSAPTKKIPGITHNLFAASSNTADIAMGRQFSHMRNAEFTGMHSFEYVYAPRMAVEFDSKQFEFLLQEPDELYVFFSLKQKDCYFDAHMVCLHKNKHADFTYYDPNRGVYNVSIRIPEDLIKFKTGYLDQYSNYMAGDRIFPRGDKPQLTSSVDITLARRVLNSARVTNSSLKM